MESRQDELVKAMMEEVGGTIGISMFQMVFVPSLYRMAASAAYDVKGEIIPADYPHAFFMAIRQPAGDVACFAPFNVPHILGSRSIALPVAYGNTAVLKPSEEAPLTGGILLAEIFEEAPAVGVAGERAPKDRPKVNANPNRTVPRSRFMELPPPVLRWAS